MLINQAKSFFSPNIFPQKTDVSFILNENKSLRKHNNIGSKIAAHYDADHASFNIPCRLVHHPLKLNLRLLEESGDDNPEGVGIVKFFQEKNIFITGATGLVGKVLLEKILRSTPVGKIYILINAKDEEAAYDRMSKEIINSDLFKYLEEKHGKNYEAFVKEKLIPIVGNICEPNLGMDKQSVSTIMNEVDVIIQSAASTTLNERYDLIIDLNANAPQRLMRFAKTCKNLKLFTHISTAYVSGRREGLILEKPLIMGENARKKDDGNENDSFRQLDLGDETSLAMKSCLGSSSSQATDLTKDLKRLGRERAEFYGWYNSYHMTKAMGEMVLNEIKGDVPLLIIRPTVIESCYKEPFPGWIQGNRMFDPVIISYGKGHLPAYMADPQVPMDIIPVDMVVNTTIAAIAKHGITQSPGLNVYHAASGVVNPLKFCDFFEIIGEYFNSKPLFNSENIDKIKFFSDFSEFSKYTRDELFKRTTKKSISSNAIDCLMDGEMVKKFQKLSKPKVAYAEQLCKMYECLGFIKGRFHTGNTMKLLEEMSEEERLNFEIDARTIDWKNYFSEIHIPGLIKHVLNGSRMHINK